MSVSATGEVKGPYMPNALEDYYEPPEGEQYVGKPIDDDSIQLRNKMIEVHRARMLRYVCVYVCACVCRQTDR